MAEKKKPYVSMLLSEVSITQRLDGIMVRSLEYLELRARKNEEGHMIVWYRSIWFVSTKAILYKNVSSTIQKHYPCGVGEMGEGVKKIKNKTKKPIMSFTIVPKKMKYLFINLIPDLCDEILNAQERNQRRPT